MFDEKELMRQVAFKAIVLLRNDMTRCWRRKLDQNRVRKVPEVHIEDFISEEQFLLLFSLAAGGIPYDCISKECYRKFETLIAEAAEHEQGQRPISCWT